MKYSSTGPIVCPALLQNETCLYVRIAHSKKMQFHRKENRYGTENVRRRLKEIKKKPWLVDNQIHPTGYSNIRELAVLFSSPLSQTGNLLGWIRNAVADWGLGQCNVGAINEGDLTYSAGSWQLLEHCGF